MKKKVTTISLLVALSCFAPPPSLRANEPSVNIEEPINPLESSLENPDYVAPNEYQEQIDEADEDEYTEPLGAEVSPETNEAQKAERKEFYKNIALAALAVVIAVVSIIVVSNNNGTKK